MRTGTTRATRHAKMPRGLAALWQHPRQRKRPLRALLASIPELRPDAGSPDGLPLSVGPQIAALGPSCGTALASRPAGRFGGPGGQWHVGTTGTVGAAAATTRRLSVRQGGGARPAGRRGGCCSHCESPAPRRARVGEGGSSAAMPRHPGRPGAPLCSSDDRAVGAGPERSKPQPRAVTGSGGLDAAPKPRHHLGGLRPPWRVGRRLRAAPPAGVAASAVAGRYPQALAGARPALWGVQPHPPGCFAAEGRVHPGRGVGYCATLPSSKGANTSSLGSALQKPTMRSCLRRARNQQTLR
mmetsp:Transcript_4194/g.11593  ORF Transcript_4194/g.11593 Transcript_4194/m.11593 type:complete len:298 (+) Transcript_4194:729-1622(+)